MKPALEHNIHLHIRNAETGKNIPSIVYMRSKDSPLLLRSKTTDEKGTARFRIFGDVKNNILFFEIFHEENDDFLGGCTLNLAESIAAYDKETFSSHEVINVVVYINIDVPIHYSCNASKNFLSKELFEI